VGIEYGPAQQFGDHLPDRVRSKAATARLVHVRRLESSRSLPKSEAFDTALAHVRLRCIVTMVGTASGVNAQPEGMVEITLGAENRASAARADPACGTGGFS
jgi:hypothetical protein